MRSGKQIPSFLVAACLMLGLSGCATQQQAAPSGPSAGPDTSQQSEVCLPYHTDSFLTVDKTGNRITTGRDATASKAMVSSSKYEVSQVGAEIIAQGGSAVDAAVAMGFALGVCEPFTSGLGGGGLATVHTADGQDIFIDFRETAPAAIDPAAFTGEGAPSSHEGGLASCIPGEAAGLLYLLENYGTMTREQVLAPAIRIAEEGFLVSDFFAGAISNAYMKMVSYPELQTLYCTEDGLPCEAGTVIRNPDLAKTLKLIARDGADVFYKGEIAQAIVSSLAAYGGVMTAEDLSGYEIQLSTPVESTYRGYSILSAPPPSSGGTHLIEILNILENYDVASMRINSPEYIHLFTEASKLAFADRAAYMADVNFVPYVPLDGLTSKEYGKLRACCIDPEKALAFDAGDPTLGEHLDTTHFSVADAQGNCVAITKTINSYFGSGVLVEGCGFIMNNQMGDFSPDPDSINCVEPGKKPLSSMSPTIVLKEDGSPYLVMGTPGGAYIFSSVAQTISRIIDHGMNIHDAICVPKVWNVGSTDHLEYELPLQGYEQYAVTEDTLAVLEQMGHGRGTLKSTGSTQAVAFLEDGSLYGTADPRQDGKAVGID